MNRNRKANNNVINLKARRELKRKQRINKIKSVVFTAIAMINIFLMCSMLLSALFIDYTETEKSFMFIFLGVAIVCLFIADPKEFTDFFKDIVFNNNINDYIYEEDDYDEENDWYEE